MHVIIQTEPLNPGPLLAGVAQRSGGAGAIVSFTGVVRPDASQGPVTALELEAYPGFTERAIHDEAERVARRCALLALTVVHRIGSIQPGEAVVFVAAAAAHRRSAFDAVDRMMDYLKTSAPLWKAEHGPGGSRWIEPAAQDYVDASRWADPKAAI